MTQVSVILVAGGVGSRMRSQIPKQFLPIAGKPMALHSLELFSSLPEISELVVVCAEGYRSYFSSVAHHKPLRFAPAGATRQESTYNGLCVTSERSSAVCIHDAARPLVTKECVQKVLAEGVRSGAAALAVPVQATLKQADCLGRVERTLDRSAIWEIQTPQVIWRSLLLEAFAYCHKRNLQVTDDVALVEAFGKPVQLVEGLRSNLKLTSPEDLPMAEWLFMRTVRVPCS